MQHKYNLGVIGNCGYMAYVDLEANVSWMCWPRFDSSFVFGGLLDKEKGGHFYIKPECEEFTSRQYYLSNTVILCTEFECTDGKFRVIDFAPRFHQYERTFKPLKLVRIIEPLEGHPKIIVSCKPVGNYGKTIPESYIGSNHIQYLGLEQPLRLTTDIPQSYLLSERPVILDKTSYCVLAYGLPLEAPLKYTAEDFFNKTKAYWREWVNRAAIPNLYQEQVIRSALTLKMHQFEDTGAIIASGTTSLPEHPGGGRNWDYRFCWMRDSYYTLRALNNMGHFEELVAYAHFIQNVAVIQEEHYQPLYSITGNPEATREAEIDLEGYMGNKPVRLGNQAHEHVQNDVYGQVLVSLLPLYTDARFVEKDEKLALKITRELLQKIESKIDDADAGLWEFRNKQQKHCYTFLFHWAGSNAAAKIFKYFAQEAEAEKAMELAQKAAQLIEQCYDPEEKVYYQAIGSKNLDASLFQLVTMGYLNPASEKARNHIHHLAEKLRANEFLMFRYRHPDDFGKPKSTFLVCAFWYLEALATVGEVEKAQQGLEVLLQYSNHLGLFSEDVEASNGSQWGNFPQTYSHVGLMNTAFIIANKLNKPEYLLH